MKFLYAYKTKDNVRHEGVVSAASKDAAYATLKGRGIKPIRVDEAPGILNKVFGRGKRWLAIGVLSVVAVLSLVYASRAKRGAIPANCEDRAQLYGDPAVVQSASERGWQATFQDVGEAWLARHAVPGQKCDCELRAIEMDSIARALMARRAIDVEVKPDDLAEIAKMKRMVNGMKHELDAYVKDGGFVKKYMSRVDIRQKAEAGILESARRELRRVDDPDVWKRRNAELRAMGLPMVAEDDLR